jgi:hypothetical protein
MRRRRDLRAARRSRPLLARIIIAGIGGIAGIAGGAEAQPLRLRADALAAVESPVGLLSLEAEAELQPGLRAEAVVWFGGGQEDGRVGEALIIDVQALRADGRAAAKLGRMIAAVGALRPLHLDGAWARASLPWQLQAEAFAGVPVEAGVQGRGFDWLAGARLGRRVGDFGGVGVAYLQQRDRGSQAVEELAFDAGAALGRRADAAARLSLDLLRFGLAEAQLSAAMRRGRWRGELFFSERHASHLLPATSLFSVLGDAGARRAGIRIGVRAAPRLELSGEADVHVLTGEDAGLDGVLRAQLALGDRRVGAVRRGGRRGALPMPPEIGALALELRRAGATASTSLGALDRGWLGARGTARIPLGCAAGGAVIAAAELELVRPDDDDRGALWPWALAALTWRRQRWETAVAIEASASPEHTSRVDALLRVSRSWELL